MTHPLEWQDSAACLGMTDMFYDKNRTEQAIRVCRSCPVLGPCREWALSSARCPGSVLAGLTDSQRRRSRRSQHLTNA